MVIQQSIDKVSLILKSSYQEVPEHRMLRVLCQMNTEGWLISNSWINSKLNSFRYNYTINHVGKNGNIEEGTIYIGIRSTGRTYREEKETKVDNSINNRLIKIEYNPNKTKIPNMIKRYLDYGKYTINQIQSIDWAIDLINNNPLCPTLYQPQIITPKQIRINTRADIQTNGTMDNKTIYIRPKADHGRIKIYDKTAERALHGIEIPQTTRIEISIRHPLGLLNQGMPWESETIETGSPADDQLDDIVRMLQEISIPSKRYRQIRKNLTGQTRQC